MESADYLFEGLSKKLQGDGRLLISQHFPKGQLYAKDVVGGPEDLLRMAERAGFVLQATLETDRFVNHHLAALWSWN